MSSGDDLPMGLPPEIFGAALVEDRSKEATTPLPQGPKCHVCEGSGRLTQSVSTAVGARSRGVPCSNCNGRGVLELSTSAAPPETPEPPPDLSPYQAESDGAFFRRMGQKMKVGREGVETTTIDLKSAMHDPSMPDSGTMVNLKAGTKTVAAAIVDATATINARNNGAITITSIGVTQDSFVRIVNDLVSKLPEFAASKPDSIRVINKHTNEPIVIWKDDATQAD